MSLFVLSAADVARVAAMFSPEELTALAASVFRQIHSGEKLDLPQRTLLHADAYKALFMPSRLGQYGTSIKTVSMPLEGTRNGLPATTLLLDDRTGAVKAVVNARVLTALRTAAGSALASQLLGPTNPTALAVFGAGKQSETHIDLLASLFPTITHCTIANRSINKRLQELLVALQSRFPAVDFQICMLQDTANLAHIVSSADVICTTTSSVQPLFQSSWVKPGTHINLIGSYTPEMEEVDEQLIKRAGKILVDSRRACFAEAGEIINAQLRAEDLVEVGELFDREGQPVPCLISDIKSTGDITIFKSVGVGAMDTAIASAVVGRALKSSIGVNIIAYD